MNKVVLSVYLRSPSQKTTIGKYSMGGKMKTVAKIGNITFSNHSQNSSYLPSQCPSQRGRFERIPVIVASML
jgi:hypothetical protein